MSHNHIVSVALVCWFTLATWGGVLAQGADSTADGSGSDTTTEAPDDTDGEGTTWRPRGGSMFGGSSSTRPMTSGGHSLTERPVRPSDSETTDDGSPEVLVFDLTYADEVTFSERYQARFEESLAEVLDETEGYHLIRSHERRRRFTEASVILGDEFSDDRAETIAASIGAEYYLVPRILVEDSRNYRISVTFGQTGEGDGGRMVHDQTSNRVIDNVERNLVRVAREALSPRSEEDDD